MQPRFHTVLFDLDGTLTDSAEGILNSVQYALQRIGRRFPREATRFMIGPPLKEGFAKLLGDSELALRCVGLYREYFRDRGIFENRVYPGVMDMLETLARAGVRSAVATSKPEPYARRIAEHFGLAPLLADVAGADMQGPVQAKKDVIGRCLARLQAPLRPGLKAVAEQGLPASGDFPAYAPVDVTVDAPVAFGLDVGLDVGRQSPPKSALPESAYRDGVLMVGDRFYDIHGAHEAGLACAGVLYGYGTREELAGAGADWLCESPLDVAGVALGTPR